MRKYLLFILFAFLSCSPTELTKLASETEGSRAFYQTAREHLEIIYDQCDREIECFDSESLSHLQKEFCPNYQAYQFTSQSQCLLGGQDVMDLVADRYRRANERGEILDTINDREREKREKDDQIDLIEEQAELGGKIRRAEWQRQEAELEAESQRQEAYVEAQRQRQEAERQRREALQECIRETREEIDRQCESFCIEEERRRINHIISSRERFGAVAIDPNSRAICRAEINQRCQRLRLGVEGYCRSNLY